MSSSASDMPKQTRRSSRDPAESHPKSDYQRGGTLTRADLILLSSALGRACCAGRDGRLVLWVLGVPDQDLDRFMQSVHRFRQAARGPSALRDRLVAELIGHHDRRCQVRQLLRSQSSQDRPNDLADAPAEEHRI